MKRAKASKYKSPDNMSYDPTDKVDMLVFSHRSPDTLRRETSLAYGRSLESTDVVDSRSLSPVASAPVFTCVDPGSTKTTGQKTVYH